MSHRRTRLLTQKDGRRVQAGVAVYHVEAGRSRRLVLPRPALAALQHRRTASGSARHPISASVGPAGGAPAPSLRAWGGTQETCARILGLLLRLADGLHPSAGMGRRSGRHCDLGRLQATPPSCLGQIGFEFRFGLAHAEAGLFLLSPNSSTTQTACACRDRSAGPLGVGDHHTARRRHHLVYRTAPAALAAASCETPFALLPADDHVAGPGRADGRSSLESEAFGRAGQSLEDRSRWGS